MASILEGHPEAADTTLPNQPSRAASTLTVFSVAEVDVLLAEATRRGLFFGINFNHRYAEPVRLAREAISRGELGDLVFCTWRFGGEPSSGVSRHANLIEAQCHGLDMLEHLGKPIASVMAQMTATTSSGPWSCPGPGRRPPGCGRPATSTTRPAPSPPRR